MKKLAARCLFVIAGLATFIAVAYTLENWRAEKNWKAYKEAQEKKGEQLFWKKPDVINVPDEKNFLATPLMKSIGNKKTANKEILSKFDKVHGLTGFEGGSYWEQEFTPLALTNNSTQDRAQQAHLVLREYISIEKELEELYTALSRPHNFFPFTGEDPLTVDVPNFIAYRVLAQVLEVHASANLAIGKTDDALRDLEVILALGKGLEVHPVLVSAMIANAIYGGPALQIAWEGLALRAWSPKQLERIEGKLKEVNLVKTYDRSIRLGEKAGINSIALTIRPEDMSAVFSDKKAGWFFKVLPRGTRYQNMLVYNRLMDDYLLQGYNPDLRQVVPTQVDRNSAELMKAIEVKGPYNYLAGLGIPNFSKALQTVARNQAAIHMALLACELEKQKTYPKELPENIVPLDTTTGKPLMYRQETPRYLIYSAGWNAKDDGGNVTSKADMHSPDWVWAYPKSN